MTVRIVHISDTHFGTEIPTVLAALGRSIAALSPDIIVLSGDITQRARAGQFRAAHDFAAKLPAPVLAVPGNHDIPLFNPWRRFVTPYGRYEAAFGARDWLWQGHGIAIIGFDATHPCRHTRGALDPDKTAASLSAARKTIGADTPLLAVVHQPLVVAWAEDESERLINAAAVAKTMAAHNVRAVLSGHVHVPFICTLEADFPDIDNLLLHCGAGTACSHRTRPGAPNSFNMITVDDNGNIGASMMLYNEKKAAFSPGSTSV